MAEENNTEAQEPAAYKDDDLVYVDPYEKKVVGLVEWTTAGKPKPKAMPSKEEEPADGEEDKTKRRPRKTRYYPWGTYRAMKHVHKVEGKLPKHEPSGTLDEVMEKALKEPFWD